MKTLFAFFILLTATSCFKRKETNVNAPCTGSCITFNIRVSTGFNSTSPLANIPVELGWSKPATPLGDPGRLIARGNTTDSGFISFSFKAKEKELEGGKFYVIASPGNDYFFQQNGYYGIKRADSVVNANVHVPSKATLKIIFKNFAPTSPNDYFQCAPHFLTYGSMNFGISMKKPNGEAANTFFSPTDGSFTRIELTGTTAGDQYTYFDILKKKSGVRVDARDSIYIAKGQTKTYEIEF